GLCVRLLRHRHDAEDVTQEVFLRVFRSLRGWDATRPLKPWIISIAVNRCRTRLTQRSRRPEAVDYLQEIAAGPPPDDAAELAARGRRRGKWKAGSPSCGLIITRRSSCSTSKDSPTRTSPRPWSGRLARSRLGCTGRAWK